MGGVQVSDRIVGESSHLTPSERRIAEVILHEPELVAFGTVADLAAKASAGAATVVRLANKIGFDGFTGLQQAVQEELSRRLRPAAERIRHAPPSDAIGHTMGIELDNVAETLNGIDRAMFERAVDLLVDPSRTIVVLSGDASAGVAMQCASELAALRPDVRLVSGNQVSVLRQLALMESGDVVVAIDLRRYDSWVIDAVHLAASLDCDVIAVSDSLLSPIAVPAAAAFAVVAGGVGPFDSHVGTLALCNAMVTACAGRLRETATYRLDRFEAMWRDARALRE
jgi:DNA-binding MurR/RpiR family transcriptional regulator